MNLSYKGINYYDDTKINDKDLNLYNDNKIGINVELNKISNFYSKENELFLEFKNDNKNKDLFEMSEIKFYCPILKDENDEKILNSKALENLIKTKIKVDLENTELICELQNLNLLVPRGKYTIKLYENQIKFFGKTFNFYINYSNIKKIFFLINKVNFKLFIFCLEKPIKLGKSIYKYILIEFNKNKKEQININLTEKMKKNDELKNNYDDFTYEIFIKLLKNIMNINIIIPKNINDKKLEENINTNYGYNNGDLFLFYDTILFIKKPIIEIMIKDIINIKYLRTLNKNRDFALKIETNKIYQFNNISIKFFDYIKDFFEKNNINPKKFKEEEFSKSINNDNETNSKETDNENDSDLFDKDFELNN